MEKDKSLKNKEPLINTKPLDDGENNKPNPIVDRSHFEFNDLKKGQEEHGHFVIRNIGGPYSSFEMFVLEKDPFIKIISSAPQHDNQPDKFPMKVCFEAKADDWSKRYINTIIVRLDNEDEKVIVELDTQTKPVNDFAHIIEPGYIRKITSLINKIEKKSSAEISVVTIESLEGKTIEKYSNELFNTWGIGKEDKHNGMLFLIDINENKYRIEVGLGLEELISPDFISSLFNQFDTPNFKVKKFGSGIYKTIGRIADKIYKSSK